MEKVKITEKYLLTIREASIYFGMGDKRIRRLAEDNEGNFAFFNGNRYFIIRPLMEQYFMELAKKEGQDDAESDT